MTDQETTNSLDDFATEFETAIEELESVKEDLSDLSEWTETASTDLEDMSIQDQGAVKEQASELKGQLRILNSPNDLVEFGERFKKSFSKPVEQSALQGLEDTVEALGIELPSNRLDELRETIRSRTPSDHQDYSEGYQHAITMLQDEPDFTVDLIASEVANNSSQYLIDPDRELTPLIKNVQNRRKSLEELEDIFASAGEWVPNGLHSLHKKEHYFDNFDTSVTVEFIENEVVAINDVINEIEISIDIAAVVESDVKNRLDGISIPEFQSALNKVATKLEAFSTNIEQNLFEIDSVTSIDSVPDSLKMSRDILDKELEGFYSGNYHSLGELLGAAGTVEEKYEEFVNDIQTEIDMLEKMYSQISEANGSLNIESTYESFPEFDKEMIREQPEKAFEAVTEYRKWINTAFEHLSDEFTGEKVGALFERLHTEDDIQLSSVDFDALEELKDTVPIVIALQQ